VESEHLPGEGPHRADKISQDLAFVSVQDASPSPLSGSGPYAVLGAAALHSHQTEQRECQRLSVTPSMALRFPPTSAGQVQAEDTVAPEVHLVLDLIGQDWPVTASADAAIATAGKHLQGAFSGDCSEVHLAAKCGDQFGGERHISTRPGESPMRTEPTEAPRPWPDCHVTEPMAVAESITVG
jgi:hypothetical protein